jgi:predicted SnoaL-like aldol condensation-catalyzing enzyme
MLDKNILDNFFESVNNRETKQIGDLFIEDAEFHFPKTQPLTGRERIVRFFKILFRQYPELSFQIQGTIIDGSL